MPQPVIQIRLRGSALSALQSFGATSPALPPSMPLAVQGARSCAPIFDALHRGAAGQFGTRLQGGKDASSPRYIFTRLAAPTRHLFNEADDPLLHYLNEEGQDIEPLWCAHTWQRQSRRAVQVCMHNERHRCGFGLLTAQSTQTPSTVERIQRRLYMAQLVGDQNG